MQYFMRDFVVNVIFSVPSIHDIMCNLEFCLLMAIFTCYIRQREAAASPRDSPQEEEEFRTVKGRQSKSSAVAEKGNTASSVTTLT